MTYVRVRLKQNSEIPDYSPWWSSLEKTTYRTESINSGFGATRDLAHVNHHMFIHFIKGIPVAIISPVQMLFTHNSIHHTFRL